MIKRVIALVATICLLAIGTTLSGTPSASGIVVGRVHGSFQPLKGKIFVLVIGNDARYGNPTNSRADAIHIVGVNTKTMRGGVLNFPRDSWVSIPGYGSAKMNEALYRGGPELLARTLENLTGIRLDLWVMVGFEDFRNIIKGIGPVKFRLWNDVYDPSGSGARLQAGMQKLGPHQSLAYLRTRHSFGGGDITRTTNQGRFLLALLSKLRSEAARSPAAVLRWISITQRYARHSVSAEEMLRLGVVASHLDPEDLGNVTVPVSIGSVGAASVVFISPAAAGIYRDFRETAQL